MIEASMGDSALGPALLRQAGSAKVSQLRARTIAVLKSSVAALKSNTLTEWDLEAKGFRKDGGNGGGDGGGAAADDGGDVEARWGPRNLR